MLPGKIHTTEATGAGLGPGGGPGFVENNASGEAAWLAAQVPTHTSCVRGPEVDGKLVKIQITWLNVGRLALCLFVASMCIWNDVKLNVYNVQKLWNKMQYFSWYYLAKQNFPFC